MSGQIALGLLVASGIPMVVTVARGRSNCHQSLHQTQPLQHTPQSHPRTQPRQRHPPPSPARQDQQKRHRHPPPRRTNAPHPHRPRPRRHPNPAPRPRPRHPRHQRRHRRTPPPTTTRHHPRLPSPQQQKTPELVSSRVSYVPREDTGRADKICPHRSPGRRFAATGAPRGVGPLARKSVHHA